MLYTGQGAQTTAVTLRRLLILAISAAASAQTPDAVFQTSCAGCHNAGNAVGAPLPQTLRQMPWQTILAALESGKMKAIGGRLSPANREAVAKYLGTSDSATLFSAARCTAPPSNPNATGWNGWADAANTRFQPARAAGLTSAATPRLKLKWAFGFPGVTTAFGSPSVYGGRIFVGAADGTVYSLNARSGCVYWAYTAAAGVRVAPVLDSKAVYFGDLRGNVYALDSIQG